MQVYRFNVMWFVLVFYLAISYLLWTIRWWLGFVFLGVGLLHGVATVYFYFMYVLFPSGKWIDTSTVNIERVEIPSALDGKSLQAVILRARRHDPSRKYVGVLVHHGYTGRKELMYRFAIPLAIQDCTVLCIDARGHGESKQKGFNLNDFLGIQADITREVDFLAALTDVDPDRLAMIGHSMGGIMTLTAGYKDARLKRVCGISAPYDYLGMFRDERETLIRRVIYYRLRHFWGKDVDTETINHQLSPRYCFETEVPIPDEERVFVIHCRDDPLVPFHCAEQIQEHLGLPDRNVLFLEKPPKKYFQSAHNLIGQDSVAATFCVQIIQTLK